MAKLTVAFHNFAKTPKNQQSRLPTYHTSSITYTNMDPYMTQWNQQYQYIKNYIGTAWKTFVYNSTDMKVY